MVTVPKGVLNMNVMADDPALVSLLISTDVFPGDSKPVNGILLIALHIAFLLYSPISANRCEDFVLVSWVGYVFHPPIICICGRSRSLYLECGLAY